MASVLFIPVIFACATCFLYFIATLAPTIDQENSQLHFPSNLEELKEIGSLLNNYSNSNPMYVLILFTTAYIYKQTFAIPGSVFLNVLAGALFGIVVGFPLTCLLSAFGASCCYLLSLLCGKELVTKYFPKHIVRIFQIQINDNRESLFYYLLFIRLFPMTPNWLINIASPLFNVPLHLFFLSVFIGLMPYNFICVQTGVVLMDLKSIQDIFTFGIILKLATIAFVALLPAAFKKYKENKNTFLLKTD